MILTFGTTPLAWIEARLPHVNLTDAQAIGVQRDGRLIAAVAYGQFRGHDIEMSVVAEHPGWCRRGIVRAMFHYPFVQLGVRRVTSIVGESNARARRLVEGLGFRLEGVHPAAMADGTTAISYGMLREDCKWL